MRIVSGGQTGVDRAALDAAIALGIDHGGWCPAGRRAEDGPIDPRYCLRETAEVDYAVRTELNVRDSEATLVICRGEPSSGTLLTVRLARQYARPLLIVDLEKTVVPHDIRQWLVANGIECLNVAGPRESQSPGIGAAARDLLVAALA
jgi:hypothetical protein